MYNYLEDLERTRKFVAEQRGVSGTPAVLGDGNGNVIAGLDIGHYWVREQHGDGTTSPPFPMHAEAGASLPEAHGLAVDIIYDATSNQRVIRPPSYQRALSVGQYPAASNAAGRSTLDRPQLNGFLCTRHPDSTTYPWTVLVFPGTWINGGLQIFGDGTDTLDMESDAPSAGEHRLAIVYIEGDGNTPGYALSTAVNKALVLDEDDYAEAWNNAPAGALPVWAWTLDGDADKLRESDGASLRQFVSGPPQPVQQDVTAATATIRANTRFVTVNYAGAVTLTLPSAANARYGFDLTIIDTSGAASSNTITVQRAGSDTLDGGTSTTITTDYGSVKVKAVSDSAWVSSGGAGSGAGSSADYPPPRTIASGSTYTVPNNSQVIVHDLIIEGTLIVEPTGALYTNG